MAHFLEHLVFKGGEKYPTLPGRQRDGGAAGRRAERLHEPRPGRLPHHRPRRERSRRRSTCSPTSSGRPRLDAEELDRERGVVIQEINRAYDQPSTVAEYLIDRAAFGDHPLGRTVLGPEENLRSFTREGDRRVPRAPLGGSRAAARSSPATSTICPREDELHELLRALPRAARARSPTCRRPTSRRRTLVEQRDTNQSHLRMIYRPEIDRRRRAPARGAGDLLDAARRLDGLAAVRRDPREARALLLGLRARPCLRRRADPAARLGPGVGQVHRGVHADARDRRRAARGRTDRGGGAARPRLRRGTAGAGLREHRRGRPATRPTRRSSSARTSTPTRRSPRSTRVTFDEVREVAAGVARQPRRRLRGPAHAPPSSRRTSARIAPGRPGSRRSSRRSCRAQPIATIRSIGTRARAAVSSGTRTSNFTSRSAVAQLRQRDHLHEPAATPRRWPG